MDALALELLGGLDALPGARELDQHAVAHDAGFLVQGDKTSSLLDRFRGVERKPRVHLGRYAARDVLQDLAAEIHEHTVDVAVHKVAKTRVFRRSEKKRRISRCVLRLPARDGLDVAAVRNDKRLFAQGFELRGHDNLFRRGFGAT